MFKPKINGSALFFCMALMIYLLMLLCVQKARGQELPLLPEPQEGYYWTVEATYVPHLDAVRYVPIQKERFFHKHGDFLRWLPAGLVPILSGLGWIWKRKRKR